jgi:signal transduction histidine kinase
VRADRESRRVLAMASQDLRQPVNALGLFAAALEQRLRASGDETLVHDLVRSVDGLDRSLGDMLDLTRLDAVAPGIEHVALAELFQRLATRFAPEASQAGLRLRFACGAKTLDGDADLLERLLAHLVQDALRRTERGGVAVVARTAAGHLHLEVWDTGRGPQDAGAGHALPALAHAIVERLAQRLGYALSAASRPGRGTRVRIAVPAAEPVRPEVPPGCGADAAHGH